MISSCLGHNVNILFPDSVLIYLCDNGELFSMCDGRVFGGLSVLDFFFFFWVDGQIYLRKYVQTTTFMFALLAKSGRVKR